MEIIELNSARAFVSRISLDRKSRHSRYHNPIFRGQADHTWKILPSAFRNNANIFCDSRSLLPLGERTNREQIEAEFYSIFALCQELNKSGLHAPSRSLLNFFGQSDWVTFHNGITRGEKIWPPQDYHPIIALAQHSGLSTRFVDFTYDPLVAAYFAASSALSHPDSEFMAIYEIDLFGDCNLTKYDFSEVDPEQHYKSNDDDKIYQLVKTPAQYNSNLTAQKGLFLTYIEKTFRANDTFKPLSFESAVSRGANIARQYKCILSTKHVPSLLNLLHQRFYSRSSLFPGPIGCVASILESAALKRSQFRI